MRARQKALVAEYKAKGLDIQIDIVETKGDHGACIYLRNLLPIQNNNFPIVAKPVPIHRAQTLLRKEVERSVVQPVIKINPENGEVIERTKRNQT